MADIYIQFSEEISAKPKEMAWLKNRIAEIETTGDAQLLERYGIDALADPRFEAEVDFREKFEEVWFYSDDVGNPWHVAALMQDMFLHFKRDQWCFAISWSYTCSKPRAGEFGGGTHFVTADSIETVDTHTFRDQKQREWNLKTK